MSEIKKHSRFSASGSHRWRHDACPGSVQFTKGMKSEDSVFSIEGNAAHALGEAALVAQVCPTKLRVKKYIKDKTYLGLITDEMREHVKKYYDKVVSLAKGSTLKIETKLDLNWMWPKGVKQEADEGLFGTLDAAIIEPWGDIHIVDLKYGRGVQVEAKENSQLIYYALGIAHQTDWDFGKVHLNISQPRREHEPHAVVTKKELKAWVDIFQRSIVEAKKPNAPLRAGDWCHFCPGAAVCPAKKKKASELANVDFDDEVIVKDKELLPAIAMTPEQIANVLNHEKLFTDWFAAVRGKAFKMLESGEEVPGYKLVDKRASRVWTEPVKVEKLFSKHKKKKELFTVPELKSPAQVEKVLGKKSVDALVTYVSSGKTIAKENDKRGAVKTLTVHDAFDDGEF